MYKNNYVLFIFATLILATSCTGGGNDGDDTTAIGGPSVRRGRLPSTVDYIVLGGGTAGSVVASRLSEDPRNKVLVIEAGTDYHGKDITADATNWQRVAGSPLDWNDLVVVPEPRVNFDLQKRHITQGRALGGCSSINSAMYVRSDPWNYDNWAAMGNPGWSYNDVLPFFKRAETSTRYLTNPAYHGNSGPLRLTQGYVTRPEDDLLIQAAQNRGLSFVEDWNGTPQVTNPFGYVGFHEYTIFNVTRQNSWTSFLRPRLGRNNLFVRDSSFVLKINFRNKKAVSVDWMDFLTGEVQTTRARDEIILSLGAMRSSQILRISGVGDTAELQSLGIDVVHHLPGVGKNLQDHPIATFSMAAPGIAPCPPTNRTLGTRVNYFIRTSFQPANDPRPDIQVHAITPCSSIFALVYLLIPKSRGVVTLSSRDPSERPQPIMNNFNDPEGHDLAALIEGMRKTIAILASPPLNAVLTGGPANISNDASVASYILGSGWTVSNTNSGNHLVGSCKMGPASDPMAVVDHRLRVHGVDNLRVVDSSIMPSITTGNTQAPTYMIAEKGSQMILEDN